MPPPLPHTSWIPPRRSPSPRTLPLPITCCPPSISRRPPPAARRLPPFAARRLPPFAARRLPPFALPPTQRLGSGPSPRCHHGHCENVPPPPPPPPATRSRPLAPVPAPDPDPTARRRTALGSITPLRKCASRPPAPVPAPDPDPGARPSGPSPRCHHDPCENIPPPLPAPARRLPFPPPLQIPLHADPTPAPDSRFLLLQVLRAAIFSVMPPLLLRFPVHFLTNVGFGYLYE
ncbi:hypothetical protein B0H11DRAFT_2236346 [Mycena galericulata]|nr:hypothetical protein B0H11DRAFT_2236346 [Mycena galericulata]